MVNLLQRAVLPLLILSGGIWSLVYGVNDHFQEVFEEQEIEISLAPPGPPPGMPLEPGQDPPPGMGDPGPFGNPPGMGEPPGMGGPPGMDLPPEMGGPPPGSGFPEMMGGFGLPPELQKIKQKVLVGTQEPESALVFDVTIGGLVRLESGELKRTYSGEPPSLCPT